MFGSWLSNQNSKIRALIWVGIVALCWAIWKTRNDIIFYKIKHNSILQAIVRGTYWLRFWGQLQCDEHNKNLLPPSQKNDVLAFKICPKKNDVLLNLVCVHVHVGMQQSIST
jgi:hypothetical protein